MGVLNYKNYSRDCLSFVGCLFAVFGIKAMLGCDALLSILVAAVG